jgi:malonate decarboxylase beta subunit
VRTFFMETDTGKRRSSDIDEFLSRLTKVDPDKRLTPEALRGIWGRSVQTDVEQIHHLEQQWIENGAHGECESSRGRTFFEKLTEGCELIRIGAPSVLAADSLKENERVRFIAVVPDPRNRFSRARNGEVGLDEGWSIARCVQQAIAEDEYRDKRAIVAIVDVPSQAYGHREEILGIHLACAAAVDAYATARLA